MRKRVAWIALSCLMVTALVLSSCTSATTESTPAQTVKSTTTEPAATATTAKTDLPTPTLPVTVTPVVEDKTGPQYGGRMTLVSGGDPTYWDPYYGSSPAGLISFYGEKLSIGNWALDRAIWDFKPPFAELEHSIPHLAESWEIPDPLTYIFHVRQGVYWQDKPPVYGRELTAKDFEYIFHRATGLGSGFTEAIPAEAPWNSSLPIVSITAIDKYTVVFKLSEPKLDMLNHIVNQTGTQGFVLARESLEAEGGLGDWRNHVGTGPFILTDYVSGSSISFIKNPNYWGYDERYPENKLPYVDEVKMLIIPDFQTRLAALRSGKIDLQGFEFNAEQAASVQAANPELIVDGYTKGYPGISLAMRLDRPPFDDIRVREAMQHAINRDEIVAGYYQGFADPEPYAMVGEYMKGWYTPFDEWPEEDKARYTYDPELAKQLLADAGYPNGLKIKRMVSTTQDMDIPLILNQYFAAIGVEVEFLELEAAAYSAAYREPYADFDMMFSFVGVDYNALPIHKQTFGSVSAYNFSNNHDDVYDEMIEVADAILDLDEQILAVLELEAYVASRQWTIWVARPQAMAFWQPWFKGYGGEVVLGWGTYGPIWARVWIDQELKAEMQP